MAFILRHHRLFEKEILRLSSQKQQQIYRTIKKLSRQPQSLPPNTLQIVLEEANQTTALELKSVTAAQFHNRHVAVTGNYNQCIQTLEVASSQNITIVATGVATGN